MKFDLRYHSVLVALLFFTTSLLFADKDKDKDKDGDGGDRHRGNRNLRIVAAEPDLDAGTLLITGYNFSRGESFNGVVKLFFPPEEGPTVLTVIEFDPVVPQMILAGGLPAEIEESPGTYVLHVRRGHGPADKDKDKDGHAPRRADEIDVTFGAVGPEGLTGPQGEQGKIGPEGPLGPIGSQGEQGKLGPQGEQGKVGPQGEQGKIGPQGEQGKLGPQGPVGPTGPTGDKGDTGDTGAQGVQGKLGPQGEQGKIGPIGDTGLQGPQGKLGPQGEQGKIGPQGEQSKLGPQGPVGPTGPTGDKGDTGDTGAQGVQGKLGPQGEQGKIGPIGDTGLQGPQGKLGPQGAQGKVGAQGEQGKIGPQGEQGKIGSQGEQGKLGPQGPVGPTGPTGDKGDTGDTGAQGVQGKIGPQGEQGKLGPIGDTGLQGPQGKIGPSGDTGSQGVQGKIGAQGVQGKIGPQGPPGPNVVDSNTSFASGVIPAIALTNPLDLQGAGSPNGPDGVRGVNGFGDGFGFLGSSSGGIRGETFFGNGDAGVLGADNAGGGFGVLSLGDMAATGAKPFLQPHPTDPTKQIVFVALEGNENGTCFRGTTTLVNGLAEIVPPEEWQLTTSEEGITAQVTPRGPATVWVESETREQIVIRGTADVQVNYLVLGIRYGFEDLECIQPNIVMPTYRGVPYAVGFSKKYQQIFIDNGILNPDLTPNEEICEKLGWRLKDPPPGIPMPVANAKASQVRRQR